MVDILIEVASTEIGVREIGRNWGPDVIRFRKGDGTGLTPYTRGAWCAAFVSYCLLQTYGGKLPFKTSRGAKRLVNNAGKAGRFIQVPTRGALICWHRGVLPWQGHVGIVVNYDESSDTLITIEGNKRDRVRRIIYRKGAWRKRLYKVAELP